jgi:hypothetical protein
MADEDKVDGEKRAPVLGEFTAEEMERIRKLDVQNIRLKASDGEVLTREQMKRLEMAVGEKETEEVFAGSQDELAKALDIPDRKSIQRWMKEADSPGKEADGRYSVNRWREWMERKGKRAGSKSKPTIEDQRAKAIALDVELKQLELAEKRGDMISREECTTILLELVSRVVGGFLQVHHALAPAVVGETVPEAGTRIRSAVVDKLEQLAALPEAAKKKTFWRSVSTELCGHLQRCLSGSMPSSTSSCITATPGTRT